MDIFNSKLEFQCHDPEVYHEMSELFISYIKTQSPKKLDEMTLKKIPEIELLQMHPMCTDVITVKVEMGRNLDKYPFGPLLSVLDRNELYDIVQSVFQKLNIEGQLFEYRDVYNISSSLRSNFEENFNIKQEDKIFVPGNKKYEIYLINCVVIFS